MTSNSRSALGPLADPFLHDPSGLEDDDLLCGHVDGLSGAGVSRFAGSALLDLENAEIAQLDPPFRRYGIDYGIERALNGLGPAATSCPDPVSGATV